MDINLLYGILAAIGLSMILTFFQSLKRKKTWKGTVTKIEKIEDVDDDGFSNNHYKIYYRTDTGKKGKVDLPDSVYESSFPNLKEDSKLIKKAGKDYPEMFQ